jgi:hypothetical protein
MPFENKRRFKRLISKYALKCSRHSIRNEQEGIYVICNDISANGIMFTSVVAFEVGELLRLSLKLPGWNEFLKKFYKKITNPQTDTYTTPATVVRVTDIGDNVYQIAAHFNKTTPARQKALMEYIYKDTPAHY